jgi:hypothetical protein
MFAPFNRLLVFRSVSCPDFKTSTKFIYERLLPFLTGMPLQSALSLEGDLIKEETEFQSVPVGNDNSFANSILECIRVIGLKSGLTLLESAYLKFLFRYAYLKVSANDLLVDRRIEAMEKTSVLLCVKSITAQIGWISNYESSMPFLNVFLEASALATYVERRCADFDSERTAFPIVDIADNESFPNGCYLDFFGRFRRDFSVEKLAGESRPPPILRPVELTLVPDRISHFLEMTKAMRHCLNLCVLLSNQRSLVRNSYTLRLCLIEHLFLRVIPLPLPLRHPERDSKCFWHAQPMRYETQSDTLRLLNMLCRHFAAASLSVKLTRSGDAMRILVFACMSTICDATLRKIACDIPSQSSLHYSGTARGPVKPFGFDIASFAEESEYLKIVLPEAVSARTQVLDYFQHLKMEVPPDNYIFRFNETKEVTPSDKRFIDQLSLQMGFDRGCESEYATGLNRAFLDYYPEIAYFRDLVFMFKLVMAPSSDQLPELNAWTPGKVKSFF